MSYLRLNMHAQTERIEQVENLYGVRLDSYTSKCDRHLYNSDNMDASGHTINRPKAS